MSEHFDVIIIGTGVETDGDGARKSVEF